MQIDVDFDFSRLDDKSDKARKNIAFSTAQGINATAIRIQRAVRANVLKRFTVRMPKFIGRQAAVIRPFAKVKANRPFAEIAVGQKKRLLLSQFEKGGTKEPVKGKRVAVPITGSPARPSFRQPVPKELRFTKLRFKRQRGKKGKKRFKGANRTFLVPEVGVFQRTGQGKRDSVLLYTFTRRPKLQSRLNFVKTARAIATKFMSEEIERRFIRSIR